MTPQRACEILHSAEVVCSSELVSNTVTRMAYEISAALKNTNPVVLCVMRGGLVFAGQLLPQLTFPLEVDTIDATRYSNTTQGGEMVYRSKPVTKLGGRTVLLVDDILDQGITLAAIREKVMALGAMRVLIAAFAIKAPATHLPVKVDFAGITLPNRYVFGFGMDVYGYWRNLPAIYALNE